jgi:hypothetical protein
MANAFKSHPDDASRTPWVTRSAIVIAGCGLWFLTQSFIGARPLSSNGEEASIAISRGDGPFHLTRSWNQFLHTHSQYADSLLVASSAVIDALGLWLFAASIFGRSIRPFVGLLLLFALRQLTQALCVLPAPEGMIWRSPGVPSFLVTYQVANDFFFSGHTAIAVFGATQLVQLRRPSFIVLGISIALFEIATVIVLRAHYTMDVFTGAVAALWAAAVAVRVGDSLDRAIAGWP